VMLSLHCGIVQFVGEIVELKLVLGVDGRYLEEPK
jgi:hypothetical protein